MDFIEKIHKISNHLTANAADIKTEASTKDAVITQVISALGYDIHDPKEVISEYTADVGTRRYEKVDYAIKKDGRIIIIIECKSINTDLDKIALNQLYRYFSVSETRLAILTNGIQYRFYSDVEAPNKMDGEPYFIFNLMKVDEKSCSELRKISKSVFDQKEVVNIARKLKYISDIKRFMKEQFTSPNDDFVKFFIAKYYTGNVTKNVVNNFRGIVQDALNQFLNDQFIEQTIVVNSLDKPKKNYMINQDKQFGSKMKHGIIATIRSSVKNSGVNGITKEEILSSLINVFPDHSVKKMRATINTQIPSRTSAEAFKVETIKNNGETRYRPA